jgi:NADH dehydrogenase [ubiquinone] 1 alpha subcomplex assembly factor 6
VTSDGAWSARLFRRTWLQGHLDEARELQPKVPAAARPLLLPAVAAGLYLDALQRADFDPFAPALRRGGFSPLWHQLVVKWRLLRGTY